MGLRPLEINNIKLENRSLSYSKKSKRADENIYLENFIYSYKKGKKVLNIDSLNIKKGSATAIIGSNGAGKSTFARSLCGLSKNFKGRLRINNETYSKKSLINCSFMVMQDVNHQLFTESVLDEVLVSMDEEDNNKAEDILLKLDLLKFKDNHPLSLSGGQKQRVAIACAMASEKEIIIFDEPTSGLDLKHMIEVSEIINELVAKGKTVIVVSHDLEFIFNSCEYILHLENGEVIDNFELNLDTEDKILSSFLV